MNTQAPPPARKLERVRIGVAVVVLSQCLGTSLWFSPAGAADGLMARWQLQPAGFAWLLAATQLGFIAGTLLMAFTGSADRWRASRIFAGALAWARWPMRRWCCPAWGLSWPGCCAPSWA